MVPLRSISRKIFFNAILLRTTGISSRLVSTSGKKESVKDCDAEQTIFKKIPDFSKPQENKNWVSYGLDEEDRDKDLYSLHVVFFAFFSCMICGGIFLGYYLPDINRKDWARREAFIRLHEREQLGLDPIDPNYIDPAKIVLPPDEELLEEDIVI